MDTNVVHIDCKLFLEGIEIPFSGISISEGIGSFPQCTLNFPAQSGATRILPGTLVQVFGKIIDEYGDKGEDYFLLFEGEVAGINYNRTEVGTRQANIQAVSLLSKWASIHKFAVDYLSTKVHQADVSFYLINSDAFNEEGKEDSDTTETPDKEIKDKDYEFTAEAVPGLLLLFQNAYKVFEEGGSDANLQPLFQKLISYFSNLDFYYGLLNEPLKFDKTLFAFPNKHAVSLLKVHQLRKDMLSQSENPNALSLLNFIQLFLERLNYRIIFPATFTQTINPATGESVPMRAYIVPNLDFAPPIKNNIIFADEKMSYSFSRSFTTEPTVYVAELDALRQWTTNTGVIPKTLVPMVMVPGLDLVDGDDVKKPKLEFTTEETYRGRNRPINQNLAQGTLDFLTLYSKRPPLDPFQLWTSDEEAAEQKAKAQLELKKKLYKETLLEFFDARYGSRSCSVSTEFNPHRIIGFPALILETEDDTPSVCGILSGQRITINSEGAASCQLTISKPRLIWDAQENIDIAEDAGEDPSPHKLDLTYDLVPFMNSYLDEDFYKIDKIGVEIYPLIQHGTLHKKIDSAEASEWDKDDTSLKEKENFYKNYFVNKERSSFYDSSLLDFIRQYETGKLIVNLEEFKVKKNDSEEIANAKLISYSIHVLKNIYSNVSNKPGFRKIQTSRNLITMTDYFKFLNVSGDVPGTLDYKDTTEVVKIENAKALINHNLTSAEIDPDLHDELKKVYSEKRKQAIEKAFGKYLKQFQQDLTTIVTR
ncbi:hypothetical protein HN682_02085 [Candidatus Peregrinibacteria bacterium]|jgi:hypothetical protein|nr:hypothetical protein [Candidatus Peregrinibacteria bacterium]